METKYCSQCHETKNKTNFSFSKDYSDLKCKICQDCSKLNSKAYTTKTRIINQQRLDNNLIDQKDFKRQCRTCKTIYPMTHEYFYYALEKTDGLSAVCIPCTKQRQKQPDRIYNFIKTQAKQKKRLFTITKEQHAELIKLPCYYCNDKADGWLDRKNSKLHYTLDNVVSSCAICNKMKRAQDSQTFIAHCQKIAKNHS